NEIGRLRIAGGSLGVHGVEQAVSRELGVKDEADESALQPVVDGLRKRGADVCVHLRRGVRADYVEESAGIVREAAAVRQIAHEADARPARGRNVLIERTYAARIGKAYEIADLDRKPAFHDR